MKKMIFLAACLSMSWAVLAQTFMRPFDPAPVLALGGASVALPDTDHSLSNPAQLAQTAPWTVLAHTALPYGLTDWNAHGFQAMMRIGKTSGAAIEILHSGVEGYREQSFSLQYGRQMGEKWRIGGSLYALRAAAETYGATSAATFAFGAQAQPVKKVTIGAHIFNPIPQRIGDDAIASRFRLGLAWQTSNIVTLLAECEKDLETQLQIKGGIMYQPHPLFRVRLGARTDSPRMSMGAGLVLKNGFSVDFGAEWHSVLGITPALMACWRGQ